MRKKIAVWKGRIPKGDYPICYLCGKPITKVEELTQDHIIPKSKGGSTTDNNLEPCHFRCNQEKGDMTYIEWLLYLSRKGRTR